MEQQPRKIERSEAFTFEFSICTLVTDMTEYLEMRNSFVEEGFTPEACEYLFIDNISQNTFEAYAGLNRFLREAQGKYIVLCHQDILLKDHGIADLRARINELDNIDPNWGAIGNAGSVNIKYRSVHINQTTGKSNSEQYLPMRVQTLDENFILVKNGANLALSSDLEGFHFYGADICLVADVLGYSSYVIDFLLIHKSEGNDDEKYYELKRKMIGKYHRAFRSRFIGTTVTRFYLSGNRFCSALGNTRPVLFVARQFYKLFNKRYYYQKLKR
ncbi:MAG: acyl esterase [Bacteroidetes bacterium]|nr:acyl esterase [Bacteroidota bacterium]